MILEWFFALLGILKLVQIVRHLLATPTFTGKRVFITGGSSGIGEHLAKRFVELGAHVVITARREEELKRVKAEAKDPSKVDYLVMDLAKPQECLKQAEGHEGKVDILINNGGVSIRDEFKEVEFSTVEHIMNVNTMSAISLTKGFLPKMIKQGGGQIVFMNSICGLLGVPTRTIYSASKFALTGFAHSLRAEV